jgi:beta-phosphoglucomutase-like phosphatase (HAD superfamily)
MENILESYDLFIFDLDDTLLMTEKIHNKAWNITLSKYLKKDFYIDFSEYCSIFHCKTKDRIKKYLVEELLLENFDEVINNKNNLFLELIKVDKPNLNIGAELLLKKILELNKKFVIVTNSPLLTVEYVLSVFPVLSLCDKYYYREMFKNKKPDPECYLKICNDYPNKKKIGFEDSITGVHALCQVDEIYPVFINLKDYYHYRHIMETYNVKNIKNFDELFLRNN